MTTLPQRVGSDGVERRGIGGSDAAAALGVHPYCPPIQLWLELTGRAEPVADNPAMEWGRRLEPVVRAKYVHRHACSVLTPSAPLYSPAVPFARATPDGIVVELDGGGWMRGLEVKTAGWQVAHRWGEDGTDQVPAEYLVQACWYMWICDLDRWDFAVLIGGSDYREYTVHRDLDLERGLVDEVSRFWGDHVLADVQPDYDDSDQFRSWLRKKHPASNDHYRDATADELELVERYRDAVCVFADAERRKKTIGTELMDVIGTDRGIMAGGDLGRITLSRRAGSPQYKAVALTMAAEAGATDEQFAEAVERSRGAGSIQLNRPKGWTNK